jgi:RNA polymerase sigma-70 factor, ECF subfamily
MLGLCLQEGEEASARMATVDRIDLDLVRNDEARAAARGGDPSARWSALEACRQYLRLVVGKKRWSKRAGGAATSDLVQDTILEGWRGFDRFEGRTPGQLRAWLRAILVHRLIKERRRVIPARLESASGGRAIPAAITPPGDAVERDARNEAIETAIRDLPEHYRAAIQWRLWDELPFAEIGSRLGISDDSAQKLYARAITKVRELVGPGHESR